MKGAFAGYDKDNDGQISRAEYYAFIDGLPTSGGNHSRGKGFDLAEAAREFDQMDRDHDGQVSLDEFAGDKCGSGHRDE